MATIEIVCDPIDCRLYNGGADDYASTRTLTPGVSFPMWVGQYLAGGKFYNYRGLLRFNSSLLPNKATINQVNMKLTCSADSSTTDFTLEIAKYDWSSIYINTSTDRATAWLGLLAATKDVDWRSTSGLSINTTYTSPNMDTAWLNRSGHTYYALRSDRDVAGTEPSGNEQIRFYAGNDATAAYRPTLVIDYTYNSSGTKLLIRRKQYRVIFDGNSMTAAASSTYPAATITALGTLVHSTYNYGVSGQTTAQMVTDGVAQIDSRYITGVSKNVVVAWEITNDLKLGADRATAYANMVAYCQARKNAGFSVVLLTILPRTQVGLPETFEADRIAINDLIKANYASYASAVADVAADSRIGDYGDSDDTTYYSDGVHMTEAGYAIVAGIVATTIQAL